MFKRIFSYLLQLLIFRFNSYTLFREYKLIKINQYQSISHNLLIQKERIYNILDFAIKNVPYYKKIAQERNIDISKMTIFEDIKKFPILTKEIIRKNWNALHLDLNKMKYIINTSGGTTGEPIRIIQDRKFFTKSTASTLVFNEIGRYIYGDKLIKLWGDERDILKDNKGLLNFIGIKLNNIIFQNAFIMSDNIIHKYIDEINQKKPKVMLAYVQSIYEMAKYIKRKRLRIHQLDSIITSAGVLTSEMKKFIESVFKCEIYNRYGSREVGIIASSCEKSDKLHINMYQEYIEILNDDNNPLREHENGNIIITNLINYGMPLIRYKIGDRGALDFSQCSCGRGLIRLDNVVGRIVDVFKTEKGELIDGEYFTHLFYFHDNIKKFQVVQEKLNEIKIFLVTLKKEFLDKTIENDIIQKIKIVMGKNCNINFNYISDITPTCSVKYRFTISKV